MQYFLIFFWRQPSISWKQRCARTPTASTAATTATASSKQQVISQDVPIRPRPNQRCYLHLWCRFFLIFSGLVCSHGPCVRGLTTPPTSAFPLMGTWQGEVRQDPQWQLVHTVSARYSWPPWLHTLTRITNSFPVLWWQYIFSTAGALIGLTV